MSDPMPAVDASQLYPGLDACILGAVLIDVRQTDQPLTYVNSAFERLTGYPAAEVLGRNCRFLEGTDQDQPEYSALWHAALQGKPTTGLLRHYRRDGSLFLNEMVLTPVRDGKGVITHLLGFLQDVTARQQLQAIVDHNPDPVMSFDRHWTMTYVNEAAADTAGRRPTALIGQPLLSLYPEVAETPPFNAAQRALNTGVNQQVITYSELLSKAIKTTAYTAGDGVAVQLHDVTAERQVVLELQATQEKFSKTFQASPLPILITRLTDGQVVDANPAFLRLTGYLPEDLIGVSSLELYANPEDRAQLIKMIRDGLDIVDHHVVYKVKSGALSEATIAVVTVDIAGEPCIVTLLRDVRDEAEAQRRLDASEQQARQLSRQLRRTLDLSLDLITTLDQERRFMSVSAVSERLLGYRPEELIGRSYLELVHPDDRERSLQGGQVLRARQELTTFQNRFVRKDGSVIWLDWNARRQPDGLTYAVARDVTERRAATEDLAFLAAIVQASPDAIIGLTIDGIIRSWNKGAERMYGYSSPEILGHQITDIVPPELLEEETQLLTRATQGEYTPVIETTRLTRSGTRIPVQLSIAPIFDNEGAVIGVSKIAQDISGRREAEQQILGLNTTLQRKLKHLTGLRQIDQAITSSLDLTITLGIVLDQVKAQLAADAVTALLLDPHELRLNYAATRGFQTTTPQGDAGRLGEDLAGRVALTRQPVVVNQLDRLALSPVWRALLDREGFTAYAAVPLIAKGKMLGVIEVLRHQPFDLSSTDGLDTLQTLAGQAAIAIDSAQLFLDLQRSSLELGLAYQATIEGWARALDLRDKETEGHSRRVTELTVKLCHALGVSSAELVQVRRGALLHDIGKMGIADAILLKPGPLTPEEWVEMRKHPTYAVELLSSIHFLRPALDIPQSHHEKWDGSGYPQGLQGTAIPLTARAFAVVDVYDALTSDRPYRKAWPREQALAYLAEQAGTHFDPTVVQTFLRLQGAGPNEETSA